MLISHNRRKFDDFVLPLTSIVCFRQSCCGSITEPKFCIGAIIRRSIHQNSGTQFICKQFRSTNRFLLSTLLLGNYLTSRLHSGMAKPHQLISPKEQVLSASKQTWLTVTASYIIGSTSHLAGRMKGPTTTSLVKSVKKI